jgi:hypothetical protein
MKDLLIAHPDDEVIFLWPALDWCDRIVCVSSDKYNPDRQWCSRRGEALAEVCATLGKKLMLFDYNSEFYRLPSRDGALADMQRQVGECIAGHDVFTHNPWGEYGHLDHVVCHMIARQYAKILVCSYIAIQSNWWPLPSQGSRTEIPTDAIECQLDLDRYHQLKAIYDKYGCWTWSQEPVTTTWARLP